MNAETLIEGACYYTILDTPHARVDYCRQSARWWWRFEPAGWVCGSSLGLVPCHGERQISRAQKPRP